MNQTSPLKVGTLDTVTRAKLKRRLVECKMELIKLEKLLEIAKPREFRVDVWKQDIEAKLKDHMPMDEVVVTKATTDASRDVGKCRDYVPGF
jgi:hypothetical protein